MHSLLHRQIHRYFGSGKSILQEWKDFIKAVDEAYQQFDSDREMLERSMELSSEELQGASSGMRAMLQAWPDIVFRLDRDGTIVDYSTQNESDLYMAPKLFLGKRIQDIPTGGVGHQFAQALDQALKTNSIVTIEYRLALSNGEKTFEARLLPIINKQIMVIVRNITDRKRTEKELEQSLSLLRATLESTVDGIVVMSTEREVVDYNRRFLDMWKIPFSVITLKKNAPLRDFISKQVKDPVNFIQKIEEIYKHPEVSTSDILETTDGRIFERYTKPQYVGKKVVGIVASFRDITEQKRLEKIIIQNEKMSAVGQLAGGIAHEINNPLGIILGFAQSLKSELKPDDPGHSALEFIESEAIRCKSLVQNLLVFSRASRTDQQDEISMRSTVEDALSLVLAQSRVKDIELVKEIADDLPKVLANGNQIQQVVINLCNNAMDAMPKGGTVTVRLHSGQRNGSHGVLLEVVDVGCGVPREIRQKIFEPFFTTKEVGKGTGLGLSLIYEIVQKHHGTIELNSEVGKGTTFTVYLPVQTQMAGEAA